MSAFDPKRTLPLPDHPSVLVRCSFLKHRGATMRRREFIKAATASVVAWPLVARAQQTAKPVIGFMSARSPDDSGTILQAFLKGLGKSGFFDGHNVIIEYRWARGEYDQLPAFAAELVQRRVNVLAATGGIPRLLQRSTQPRRSRSCLWQAIQSELDWCRA